MALFNDVFNQLKVLKFKKIKENKTTTTTKTTKTETKKQKTKKPIKFYKKLGSSLFKFYDLEALLKQLTLSLTFSDLEQFEKESRSIILRFNRSKFENNQKKKFHDFFKSLEPL